MRKHCIIGILRQFFERIQGQSISVTHSDLAGVETHRARVWWLGIMLESDSDWNTAILPGNSRSTRKKGGDWFLEFIESAITYPTPY